MAVIASLLFVGVQIRHSAKTTRRAVAQGALEALAAFLEHVSGSPERSALLFCGLEDYDSMTLEQQMQFTLLFRSNLRRWEFILQQSEEGALDDSDWEGLRETMTRTFAAPGFRIGGPRTNRCSTPVSAISSARARKE